MTKEMNLIFDLQLFTDPETLTATASYEAITVTSSASVSIKKKGATGDADVRTPDSGKAYTLIDAGSGNDSITVAATATNMSIQGGRLHDLITISGHGSAGNTYVYNYGDGNDTISGWDSEKDTLYITDSTYEVSMSSDGNDFIVKVGSGSIRFIGLTPGSSQVKIKALNASGVLTDTTETVPLKMMGGTKADKIYNYTGTIKNGTDEKPWTIDAAGGADSIVNAGNYISINAGAANDKISIKAGASDVTSGVTIIGGAGNDIINVSEDKKTSGETTTYGGHVYEYTYNADGRDTIIGYNSNDSIVIKDIPETSPYLVGDVDTLGNYLIKIGSGSILIQKPEDSLLATTHLNIFNGSLASDKLMAMGTPVTKDGKTHYEIPKKLLYTTIGDESVVTSTYDEYTVDAAAGNDTITVQAKAASIFGGSGSDSIILTGGTNVRSETNLTTTDTLYDVDKAVTIVGGYGYDTIFATNDKKTITIKDENNDDVSTEVTAAHVYQFDLYDGRDTIVGFNENDSIQVLSQVTKVSGDFDATGNHYVISINNGVGMITLNDYPGGKKINIIDSEGNAVFIQGAIPYNESDETLEIPETYNFNLENLAYNMIPKLKRGTTSSDDVTPVINIATNDGFSVDGMTGNDSIENQGASNVTIYGGYGNDTIHLLAGESGTKYGEGVIIDGGYGNDLIIGESMTSGGKQVVDDSINARTYLFGAYEGFDSIYFFGENDSIQLKENTYVISASVQGNPGSQDVVLNIANTRDAYSPTGTITLKDFIKEEADKDTPINIVNHDGTRYNGKTFSVPKYVMGTSSNDSLLSNNNDEYIIYALSGDDSIYNTGSSVSIQAGTGNDTIYVQGFDNNATYGAAGDVSIDAGSGNDKVYLVGEASGSFVSLGYGNDSVFVVNDDITQTYSFGSNDGVNYIFNFQSGDTLRFTDNTGSTFKVTKDFTEEGLVFNFGYTKVVIKGALKDGLASTSISNYEEIAADTEILIEKFIGGSKVTTSDDIGKYVVPRKIVGTNGDNNITFGNSIVNIGSDGESDNYEIYAKAGNDSIVSNGTGVSIDAGIGNDSIKIADDASANVIIGGMGNDLIYGNGADHNHVYVYNYGDGNDTILGFSGDDTLSLVGANYSDTNVVSADVTANGFEVKVGYYSILLKGERKTDVEIAALGATATEADKYNMFDPNTTSKLKIKDSQGIHEVTIDKLILGTNLAEKIEVPSEGYENYSVNAFNGNDTIISHASQVSINAGSGNDSIKIAEGEDVTILGGYGNDTIDIAHGSAQNHVFEVALGEGVNVINGINANDSIRVRGYYDFGSNAYGTNASIQSVAFGTALESDTLILTLSDGGTKIKLKESNGSDAYQKLGTKVKEFHVIYDINGNPVGETLTVPNIINVTDSVRTLTSPTDDSSTVKGDDNANTIVGGGANKVSIYAGGGNDSIVINSGSELTIGGGLGNDSIILYNSNNIIQYNLNDGKDTIYGWDNGDTLQLNGYDTFSTVMNGTTFGVQFGNYTITFKDKEMNDLDPEQMAQINLTGDKITNNAALTSTYDYNATTGIFTLAVPRLLKGTGGNDKGSKTLINNKDRYIIDALGGNDSIVSNGNFVSVSAGNGNDTIRSNGSFTTLEGGDGIDYIFAQEAVQASINAGTSGDFISLDAGVSNSTIIGGSGNDTIYNDGVSNIYVYNTGDGNDIILGFSRSDSIKLGAGVIPSVYGGTGANSDTIVTQLSSDGLEVFVSDNGTARSLLLKGDRLTTTGNALANFDFLEKATPITFMYEVSGVAKSKVVNSPAKKIMAKNKELINKAEDAGYLIIGSSGIDSLTNYAPSVTVQTGGGDDIIKNTGSNVSIDAGDGNDVILLADGKANGIDVEVANEAALVTIKAGAGNDTIYSNGNSNVFQYKSGDGNDIIYNFGDGDYIEFTDNKTSSNLLPYDSYIVSNYTDGGSDDPNYKDIIFNVGSGTITIKKVQVNSIINYKFTYGNSSLPAYGSYKVEKTHILTDSEATSSTPYQSTIEGYNIVGGSKDDYIKNTAVDVTISAGNGANSINNDSTGSNAYIEVGVGNDTITNSASNVYITASSGNNTINNSGTSADIHTGDGNDSITNSGINVTVTTGNGANSITNTNTGTNTQIQTGEGDDTIINNASIVTITTGKGADSINISGASGEAEITVEAGAGNDTIFANTSGGNRTYIYNSTADGNDGNDVIFGLSSDDQIQFNLQANETYSYNATSQGMLFTIKNSETNVSVGSILLAAPVSDGSGGYKPGPLDGGIGISVIKGEEENQIETPYVRYVTGTDLASYSVNDAQYSIQGDDAANFIVADENATNISIYGGAANDKIIAAGDKASIYGGDGNDTIIMGTYRASDSLLTTTSDPLDVIINGGAGNDSIVAGTSHTNGIIYEYKVGGGNDTIVNYSQYDTIKLDSDTTYSTSVSGNNFVINVGNTNNAIILQNYNTGGSIVNITKKEISGERNYGFEDDANIDKIIVPAIQNVTANTQLDNTNNYALIYGTSSNDTITNNANYVTIHAGAGNDSIALIGDNDQVSVYAEGGNDTIIAKENRTKNVTYVFGSNEGTNIIKNFKQGDIIYYTGGSFTTTSTNTLVSAANLSITLGGNTVVSLVGFGANGNKALVTDINGGTATVSVGNILAGDNTNNYLPNTANKFEIQGYGGQDTIYNTGSDVTIYAGIGNDSIFNENANKVSIDGGQGDDTILNSGSDVSIFGDAGNDNIYLYEGSSNTTVYGGSGIDTITNADYANGIHIYQFDGGSGNGGVIRGFNPAKDKIQVLDSSTIPDFTFNSYQNDYLLITIGSAIVSVMGTDGSGGYQKIAGNTAISFINSSGTAITGHNNTPLVQNGTNTGEEINVSGNNYYVFGLGGNDSIKNASYTGVTIDAGAGNDSIYNGADATGASINGGAEADTIENHAENVTIYGGYGDDSIVTDIEGTRANPVTYQFSYSQGTNTIRGFDFGKDVIYFSGIYTIESAISLNGAGTEMSINGGGTTVVLQADDNDSFTAENANTLQIKYGSNAANDVTSTTSQLKLGVVRNLSATADNYTVHEADANSGMKIYTFAGEDTITNAQKKVYIDASGGNNKTININSIDGIASDTAVTVYTGSGNDVITNASNYVSIKSNAGENTFTNSGANVTIWGGSAGDKITLNSGAAINSIFGAYGEDTIKVTADLANLTINGGGSNDLIQVTAADRTNGITFQFDYSDGVDTIEGFNATKDTLHFRYYDSSMLSASLNADGSEMSIKSSQVTTNAPIVVLKGDTGDFDATTEITHIKSGTTTVADETATIKANYRVLSDPTQAFTSSVANMTVAAQNGAYTITNTAKSVYIDANGSGNKTITINTEGVSGKAEAVSVNAGNGADTITNSSACTYIRAGAGANEVNNTGNNVTVIGGAAVDKITVGGSSSSIVADYDNDLITVAAAANNNTINAGFSNDKITNNVTGDNGNVYVYTGYSAEGADTIVGGLTSHDTLYFDNISIADPTYNTADGGGTLTFTYNGQTTTIFFENVEDAGSFQLKKGTNAAETFNFDAYTAPATPQIAESPMEILEDDIFEDNNFISNDPQITDITEITTDSYSAGNIETIDFASLAQNNSTPLTSYSKKK